MVQHYSISGRGCFARGRAIIEAAACPIGFSPRHFVIDLGRLMCLIGSSTGDAAGARFVDMPVSCESTFDESDSAHRKFPRVDASVGMRACEWHCDASLSLPAPAPSRLAERSAM